MSLIVPRFVVVDDIKSERKSNVATIRKAYPTATVIEASHPYFLRDLLENKATGSLLANPEPTVVLLDGSMTLPIALVSDKVVLDPRHFTDGEQALFDAMPGDQTDKITRFRGYKDQPGGEKVLQEYRSEIGDFIAALVSGGVCRRSDDDNSVEPEELNIANLSSPYCQEAFSKSDFSADDVRGLVKHLNALIALKPSK